MKKINKEKSAGRNNQKINRRAYLGAVAGSVFANAAPATAQEAELSDVAWLGDGEKYTYTNASFEVRDVFVQNSVFYQSMPDAVQVRNGDGLQYLFVNLQFKSAKTVRPPFSKFAFIADDKWYECGDVVNRIPLFAITDAYREKMGQTYHTEPMTPPESAVRVPPRYKNPTFTIGFTLPKNLSAEQFGVGIVSDQEVEAAWKLEGEVVEKLQTSPQFETPSIDGPKRIRRDIPFELSVSVKNTGQRSGTYRAVVGLRESDHKKRLTIPVPAGEEVTRTVTFKDPHSEGRGLNGESAVYQVLQDDALLAEREVPVGVK